MLVINIFTCFLIYIYQSQVVKQIFQNATLISDITKEETPPEAYKRRQTCFNCGGEHQLRECTLPRNHQRIAQMRKTMTTKMGSVHKNFNS